MSKANETAKREMARAEVRVINRVAQVTEPQIVDYINAPHELDMADIVYLAEAIKKSDNILYVDPEYLSDMEATTEYGALVIYNGPPVDEATLGAALVKHVNSL